MDVRVKDFSVNMEVKSSGIEFEVHEPNDGAHVGDCYLTMTGLIWCKGRKERANGVKISWNDFIEVMGSNRSKNKAVLAAKKTK